MDERHPGNDLVDAAQTTSRPWWHTDLLEFTHDAIIVWELRGQGVVYWNAAAERLYGWTRDEAAGRVTHDLLHTEVIDGDVPALESALARRSVWCGDLRHTTRDGRTVRVESRIVLLEQRGERWLVLEVNRDATAPRLAAPRPSSLVDESRLAALAASARRRWRDARPFPHLVLDGLFPDDVLEQAVRELPAGEATWTEWDTPHERKQVCSDVARFGPGAEALVHALNGSVFVRFLEHLTGIAGLVPDPHLQAAGYMRADPGGFLDLHEDFTTHRGMQLERRVNVLVYLNRDWRAEWGGQLELHPSPQAETAGQERVVIEPCFNRTVIFETPGALHGHPRRIACPPGRSRLCLSWYYYTAPPVPDWAARERPVRFAGGGFDARRAVSNAVRLLAPPILFHALCALRRRR